MNKTKTLPPLRPVPTLVRCLCGCSLPKGATARWTDRGWADCYMCRVRP